MLVHSPLDDKPYYYTCLIYRDRRQVPKEGTVIASNALNAIDRVYEMGQKVWKRAVLEVVIIRPETGTVLATSYHASEIPGTQVAVIPAKKKVDWPEDKSSGFIPWGEREPEFLPSSIGTYFVPKRFNQIK